MSSYFKPSKPPFIILQKLYESHRSTGTKMGEKSRYIKYYTIKIRNIISLVDNLKMKWGVNRDDIIVYDDHHPDLSKVILNGKKYFTIEFYGIYLSMKTIKFMLVNINLISEGFMFWNHACFLMAAKPKLVITLIDNTRRFQYLDRLLSSKIIFLTIQNGNRFFFRPGMCNEFDDSLTDQENSACLSGTFHSDFFCFGRFENDLYTKLSATVGRFHDVGSLVNSLHMKNSSKIAEVFDLCLVSSFSANSAVTFPRFYKSISTICEWVSRYIKNRPDIKLCIAARSWLNSDLSEVEREWYSKYGLDKYLYFREDRYSSYKLVDASEVTVSSISTLFFETLARRKKITLIDPEGYYILALPTYVEPDPILYLYDSSYDEFEKRVNELLAIPLSEFLSRVDDYSRYMMKFDPEIPTYKVIQEHIDGLLL